MNWWGITKMIFSNTTTRTSRLIIDKHNVLFVVAGSYREYKKFIDQYGYRNGIESRYVQDFHTFAGIRDGKYITIGSYVKRPNLMDIITTLKIADFVDITNEFSKQDKNNILKLMVLFNSKRVLESQ